MFQVQNKLFVLIYFIRAELGEVVTDILFYSHIVLFFRKKLFFLLNPSFFDFLVFYLFPVIFLEYLTDSLKSFYAVSPLVILEIP